MQKGGVDNDYGFVTVNGPLAFQVGDLTPNRVLGPILPVNTWSFVTGVYDASAGEMRLYLNGVLAANKPVTGSGTPRPLSAFT